MKSFFSKISKILSAFGWHIAEKPLCVNVNGQPLAFPPSQQKDTVFICVNNSEPFPSLFENAINYFELVVFGKETTYKVFALVPGGGAVVSEITNARELRNFLGQGLMIKMIGQSFQGAKLLN